MYYISAVISPESLAIIYIISIYLRLSPPPRLGDPLDILRGDRRLTAGGAIASTADVAS